jgi:antimicrobial peptide system SdpA family protein
MKIFFKKNNYFYSFLLCGFVSLFFAYHLFFYNVGPSPVKLNSNLNVKINRLVPQGWRFFIRDLRGAQVILYKKNNANKFDYINLHFNAPSHIFGLKKQSQKMLEELKNIKKELHDSLYFNSKWNYQTGILGTIPDSSVEVANYFKDPLLCGEYVLVFQKIVPWAWLKSIDSIKMPSKVIRLNIACK